MTEADPGTALFAGLTVAAIALFAGGLTYVAAPQGAPGSEALTGLALGIVGLGVVVAVLGAAVAAVMHWR